MTTSRELASLGQLSDIKVILDQALALNLPPGSICGRVPFDTPGRAINWRQRAYRFRKLYREHRDLNSPYETLTMPKLDPGECEVVIRKTGVAATFVAEGEATDDPLLDVARGVAKDLLEDL